MQDLEYFSQLKAALLKQYKAEHPHFQGSLSDFKGREIANFQEMLMNQVQGRISEKWFYTHLKVGKNEKLPRQDMLNLLARFTGYQHWDDFKKEYQQTVVSKPETASAVATQRPAEQPIKKQPAATWYFLAAIVLGLGFAFVNLMPDNEEHELEFCFVNDFSQKKIKADELKVYWLKTGETPQELNVNTSGCVELSIPLDSIVLRIEGPYFQNQTINRTLTTNHQETVGVQPDEYSTLLKYFATADVAAWKEKRAQLEALFAPEAMILQLAPDGKTGMALYNKEEFINKLTMPLKTMKNMQLVDQERNTEHQITSLKFILK